MRPTQTQPRVLIYRGELLAPSETFIASQASALRRFAPVFVGLKRLTRSLPGADRAITLTSGNSFAEKGRRAAYRAAGLAPGFFARARALGGSLIHAHFAPDGCEAMSLARALKLPLIVTLHGYDVTMSDEAHAQTRAGRRYLAQRSRLFDEARLFLCVSEAIRAKAVERGFPEDRLRVHRVGIDVARFKPRPAVVQGEPTEGERGSRKPVILFVGRLVEKKGCMHLLHAMSSVRQACPEAQLVIAGDGPERAALEEEARRSAPGALFLGMQSEPEVRSWMARCRMLAAPSIAARNGDAEGLPTVLCEALAMGVPVASFRSSGIPELIRHGREGLLARPGDEQALAENIVQLCEDDALCRSLALAGRVRVEQCFNLESQTRLLEELYAEVVDAWRP